MSALTGEQAMAMIRLAAERLRAAAPELSRLDAAAGDGDHGANVDTAFSAAAASLANPEPRTAADVFAAVARTWAETGGGAGAAVFGTIFRSLAEAVDRDAPSIGDLVEGLAAAALAVEEIGRARRGDRTVIDALLPGVDAARSALGTGDASAALAAAADAAELGADATAGMTARAGRAKYAAETALGHRDPGAVTVAVMLRAWADALGPEERARERPNHRREPLDRLATASGQFAILALDHVRSFATTMRPQDPDSMTPEAIWEWKGRLTAGLSPDASAILIDPGFAASRAQADVRRDGVGLIVGLEDSDYGSPQAAPRMLPGWTVDRAARLGADAVKVSFAYARGRDASAAERFISQLVRDCAGAGIPLLCEPLADLGADSDVHATVIEAVRRFGALGVDVLKIQFPFDTSTDGSRDAWADACAEVSARSAVPWALLSEGREFREFRELLAIACRAGASGFVAGRAIWGIAVDHPDAIRECAGRLADLREIATREGRPWHDRDTEPTTTQRPGAGVGPAAAQAQEVMGQSAPST